MNAYWQKLISNLFSIRLLKITLGMITFFISNIGYAQSYQPIDTADFTQRKDFIQKINFKKQTVLKNLKTKHQGKELNEMEKFYEDYYKEFEDEINEKKYSFNSGFETKLHNILTKLKVNNAVIPDNLDILIAKDNSPNAFCLSDGTFVINMGLLNWIDNEEQLAGVLSHEIAHNILKHSEKMISLDINQNTTDKSTYAHVNKLKTNKSKMAFDIVKNRLYKNSVLKRNQEIEADSMGYVLYKNTTYKPQEFLYALKNLQKFDSISPRKLEKTTYQLLFNLPEQPFREEWMKEEDFSIYQYDFYKDKLNVDSLSSHPETEHRIALMLKGFPELADNDLVTKPDNDFKQLQFKARKEMVPNLYYSEDYGVGIYVAMQFIQDSEDEDYYKNWLGKLFQKIYEGRKNYNLNRYLDTVNPKKQGESYRQFLNFMWNLKLEEIQKIADFYQQN